MGPQSFFIYSKEKNKLSNSKKKNEENDYSFVIEAVEEGH